MLGQVFNDEVDELDLTGVQGFAGQEAGEGLFRGFTVEANQRADKKTKPGALGFRFLEMASS